MSKSQNAVDVLVKRDPLPGQVKGDWLVKVGKGRGGKNISRHRQKSAAMKQARQEGRKRKEQGAKLWVEDRSGRATIKATYGF